MKSLSVLVADDEPNIRELLLHWLEGAGHLVTCVRSASEAKPLLSRLEFDLVVTDVLMPEGDGLQLIRALKETQPEARVLAISGGGLYMDGTDYLKMAKGFGAHAAVMKPFNREQLLAGVAQAFLAEVSGASAN